MPRPRAPWWMYVVAASFLAYFGLLTYSYFLGPEGFGASAEFRGAMSIFEVLPNSVADRAGLKRGDRVLAVDGQPIHNQLDWIVIEANFEAGRPIRLEFERGPERLQAVVVLRGRGGLPWARLLFLVATRLFVLTLAFVIAFSRPHDFVARIGAWFLGTVAVLSTSPVPGSWAAWRHLPSLLGVLLWIPAFSTFLLPALLFTFFAIFPRTLFRARWVWALVWAPAPVLSLWMIPLTYRMLYEPARATGAPDWFLVTLGLSFVAYVLGGLAALVVNYRRLEDINERRRVRVLVMGAVAAWLAVVPQILFLIWEYLSESQIVWVFVSRPVLVVSFILFLAFPLSFAYAILRHRLFDIRVMIRQGLQYALARRVVLSLVPASAAILFADLVIHGDRPLRVILVERGWVYGVLGGLALLAHVQRQQWMTALDQRFFRDRYDAQRLLREVVEEVRVAPSFAQVAPRAVARIEAALHPEFAALLVREPREAAYRTLAAAPAGQAPPQLAAESKLLGLVRLLGKPLDISRAESGWLKEQLPHDETDFLRQARIELLVPVAIHPGHTEALLVLGPKRSEEPYTREDQDLLVAIAASLALLLEKPAVAPARVSNALQECPTCGACYDTGVASCAQDRTPLTTVALPLLLAERYCLKRRLGRGGMGTVYTATDTALDRRVAVKVVREDLVGNAEAAERFRREARAAAAFAHPNVVTVYDFGTEAGTRAYLVMELLEGASLREELRQKKRLAAAQTLGILRGVCSAVDAAHRRQLIHRDLKPENIFLACAETGSTTKVLDFGIAKFLPGTTVTADTTADTATGMLVGTLAYMSPEQLSGETVGPSWDLWAIAVVAYEMLTGVQPFARATATEWQSALFAGRFTPIADHLADAPARWQEFFTRAYATDPARRPPTAHEFFAEFERALS